MKESARHAAVISAVCLLTYASSLGYFFVNDDFMWLSMAKAAALEPSKLFGLTYFHEFRPVVTLSFLGNYLLFGLGPTSYHLLNILMHSANSVLAYLVFCRIAKERKIALLGALLFAVSASHFGSVAWVSGRTGLLGALFYLSALLIFLKGKGETTSLFLFVLSLFCIEYAFTLPLVLLAYRGILEGRTRTKGLVPFFVVMAAYLVFQYILQTADLGGGYLLPGYRSPDVAQVGMATKNLFHALVILWMPFKFKEYYLPLPLGRDVYLILLVTVYLVLFSLPLLFRGSKEVRFSVSWMYLTLLPFIFLSSYVFPRHLYLPSVGFSLLVVLLLSSGLERLKIKGPDKLYLLVLLIMLPNMAFNMTEGARSFNGETTEEVVGQLLALRSDLSPSFPLVIVDPPLDDWVMVHMAEVYLSPEISVHVIEGEKAAVMEGLFGEKADFVYFERDRVVKVGSRPGNP